MTTAAIALGSNVGDRLKNLRAAREEIFALHRGKNPPRCSRVYETEPIDCPPGTQNFLNAVIEIEFDAGPRELLAALRGIEKKLGRAEAREKNAPRTIDLDIIFFGGAVLDSPDLALPHPRAHERRFVLAPLAEISPELILPHQNETVAALLKKMPEAPGAAPVAKL